METIEKVKTKTSFEQLKKETKIVDKEGNPLLMFNRSNTYFENFEIGKRNLETKKGTNKIGFFFADRNDLDNYGPHLKERYLNIKKPFDIRDLGHTIDYKTFRKKLTEIGISDKELAGYDLDFQDLNMDRNRKLGSVIGLHNPFDKNSNMYNTRMATYNFFDAGDGFYIRKLLEMKGFDGIIFEDGGHMSVIAFYPEQIIESNN
jgi:hypothetical protein